MPKATGLAPRKPYFIDRESVLVGSVRAGEGSAAGSRTGAARIMPFKLNTCDFFKIVAVGGQSSSAGGYLIKAAHVAVGGTTSGAVPATPVTIGTITFDGTNQTEVGFTGAQVEALVKAAAASASTPISGDVRVVYLELTAGTGTGSGQNGVVVPAGTGNTIHIQRG